jgi:hypothetical protein
VIIKTACAKIGFTALSYQVSSDGKLLMGMRSKAIPKIKIK